MKRPLWLAGCAAAVTLSVLSRFGLDAALISGALLLVLTLLSYLIPPLRRHTSLHVAGLSCVLICLACCAAKAPQEAAAKAAGTTVTVTAQVKETVDASAYTQYTLLTESGDLPADTRLICFDNGNAFEEGTYLTGQFLLEQDHGQLYVTPVAVTPLPESSRSLASFSLAVRRYARAVLGRRLSDTVASVPLAMTVADRSALSDATRNSFRDAGVSHLLVTSGLHMTIVTMAALAMLQTLGLSRRLAALLACLPVVAFMTVCGFGYSVCRAGIMCLLQLLAQTGRREADGLNSLGGALFLILFFDPAAVSDIGLWLSFGSTAGILILTPPFNRLTSRITCAPLRRITSAVCITLAALLPTLPLLALYFRRISLIALPANLITVPVATPLLIVTFLALLLSPIPFLADGLLFSVGLLSRYLLTVTTYLASLPGASPALDDSYIFVWLIGTAVLLVITIRFFSRPMLLRILCISLCTLLCAVTVTAVSMNGTVTLTFLDVPYATAILVQTDGCTGLFLSANRTGAMYTTVRRLIRRHITALDVLILPDTQNGAGLQSGHLISDVIPVRHMLAPSAARAHAQKHTLLSYPCAVPGLPTVTLHKAAGCIRLCCGNTGVLITPADGNASLLPLSWRTPDVVVFDRSVPLHAAALTASCGVCCGSDDPPAASPGDYPLAQTDKEEAVLILRNNHAVFRRKGDFR